MEDSELLKILVWPLVVAFLIWVLRKELGTLILGITELNLFGQKVTTRSQELSTDRETRETIEPSAEKAATGAKGNPIIVREVDAVREQLASVAQNEREDRLIIQLAMERLHLRYERSYRIVYTSQLNALLYLRGREKLSAPLETVETYWEAARPSNPSYTFEAWLSFLISWDFVEKGSGGIIKITDNGLLFLETIAGLGWSLTPNTL